MFAPHHRMPPISVGAPRLTKPRVAHSVDGNAYGRSFQSVQGETLMSQGVSPPSGISAQRSSLCTGSLPFPTVPRDWYRGSESTNHW